jgi:hypothetical protein
VKSIYNSNLKIANKLFKNSIAPVGVIRDRLAHYCHKLPFYMVWCSKCYLNTCFGSVICCIGKFYFEDFSNRENLKCHIPSHLFITVPSRRFFPINFSTDVVKVLPVSPILATCPSPPRHHYIKNSRWPLQISKILGFVCSFGLYPSSSIILRRFETNVVVEMLTLLLCIREVSSSSLHSEIG